MDNETESKIVELQICIEEGHSYNLDIEALDGQKICLTCSVCDYTKYVELTDEQLKTIDSLFDKEIKLLDSILKNKD